ncbi:MAG: hypothetical protein ACLSVD_08410 [Eggerthellaceae bacterium]
MKRRSSAPTSCTGSRTTLRSSSGSWLRDSRNTENAPGSRLSTAGSAFMISRFVTRCTSSNTSA